MQMGIEMLTVKPEGPFLIRPKRVYGGQVRREPDNYLGYSDHCPDLALLLDGELTVFDLKVFDPIGSTAEGAGERGGYVAFGNTMERANVDVVLMGRRGRGIAGFFNTTGAPGRAT